MDGVGGVDLEHAVALDLDDRGDVGVDVDVQQERDARPARRRGPVNPRKAGRAEGQTTNVEVDVEVNLEGAAVDGDADRAVAGQQAQKFHGGGDHQFEARVQRHR